MKKVCKNANVRAPKVHGGTRLACLLAALTLAACGKSSPGVADITPALMADISQCDLWTVSDVKKVDGIPGKESYRVDFSAKLVLKSGAEETMQKIDPMPKDANAVQCLMVASMLMRSTGALWKSYDVSGAGEFVKSEKGWRLAGELGQYDFAPTQGQTDTDRALPRPVGYKTQAAPPTAAEQAAPVQQPVETAAAEPELPPCVAAKMKTYEENWNKEIEEMRKTAQANGEEVRTSAGAESHLREEALEQAKVECK